MSEQETIVIDDAIGMAYYYLCTLKMALKLHEKGIKMTRRAPSPYTIAKSYGYTGTRAQIKAAVLKDVEQHQVPAPLLRAIQQRRGEAV